MLDLVVPHYDMLNCNTTSSTLEILVKEKLEWEWVYKPKQAKIISSIWDGKLVRAGSFGLFFSY